MQHHWFVIVNPISGARKGVKAWKQIKPLMEGKGLQFISRITERDKHSTQLVADAVQDGFRKFICVGGDGTLHNMLNGIMKQKVVPSTEITLMMISVGTGNDWIKNYRIPTRYSDALDLIDSGKPFIQDVGHITFHKEGNPEYRYFHNFAGVGFDAYVVEKTVDLKRIGTLAYSFGLARSLFQYKVQKLKIDFDQQHYNEKMYMMLAGIGRYGGGGMKLTPNAEMDDGLFDLMIAKNFTIPEIIMNTPRLFNGSFIRHKKVDTFRTANIAIEANGTPGNVFMEADGELIGTGPFELKIVPNALKVLIP